MRKPLVALAALALGAGATLAGCGVPLIESNSKDVFVLVDASGTYAKNMPSAVKLSRLLVSRLNPKDSLSFGQISSCSFADENLIMRATLSSTPSRAAHEKQDAFVRLDTYAESFRATSYTDIRGALKYAALDLQQSGRKRRFILLFTDLVEDTAPDCDTSELSLDLTGITVVATNVTKLKSDAADPEAYFERLAAWEQIVTEAGGTWTLAVNSDQVFSSIQ